MVFCKDLYKGFLEFPHLNSSWSKYNIQFIQVNIYAEISRKASWSQMYVTSRLSRCAKQ